MIPHLLTTISRLLAKISRLFAIISRLLAIISRLLAIITRLLAIISRLIAQSAVCSALSAKISRVLAIIPFLSFRNNLPCFYVFAIITFLLTIISCLFAIINFLYAIISSSSSHTCFLLCFTADQWDVDTNLGLRFESCRNRSDELVMFQVPGCYFKNVIQWMHWKIHLFIR